jgi:hypothetical protein
MAPGLYGLAFDQGGSYDRALVASAAALIACTALLLTLGNYPREEAFLHS